MSLELCPVCNGRQFLPNNFYTRSSVSTSVEDVKCKSCDGLGYISVNDWIK